MPVRLGDKGQSGFDEPLALLCDCHRRIERFLGVLRHAATRPCDGDLDQELRQAVVTSLEYFRTAAPRHTADEEDSLFPRLRDCTAPRGRVTLARLEQLEADHEVAAAGHAEAHALLDEWLTDGKLARPRWERLVVLLEELEVLYWRHIAIEESELYPLAAASLAREQLAAIGREMAQRRGLDPGGARHLGATTRQS